MLDTLGDFVITILSFMVGMIIAEIYETNLIKRTYCWLVGKEKKSSDNLKWRNNNYTKKWVAIDDVIKQIEELKKEIVLCRDDDERTKYDIDKILEIINDVFPRHITKSNSKDSKVKDK